MKIMKKGFSLAEVLIAVTIAAIIGTLGFTIAKKGIARAYDRYVYAGFYALDIALKDAAHYVKEGETSPMQLSECFANGTIGINSIEDPDADNTCYFTQRLYDVLEGRNRHGSDRELAFDVPNGINFSINSIGAITSPTEAVPKPRNTYAILITVPSVKTSNNSSRIVLLGFVENHSYIPPSQAADPSVVPVEENILVPYYNAANTMGFGATQFIQNINERIDLLPFYLENETTGKVIDGAYVPRRFHNARQAYCTAIGNINPFLNCTAADVQRVDGNIESGVLRVADPRRL